MKKSNFVIVGFLTVAIATIGALSSSRPVEESSAKEANVVPSQKKSKVRDDAKQQSKPLVEKMKAENLVESLQPEAAKPQARTLASLKIQNLSKIETTSLQSLFQDNYYSFHNRKDFSWSERVKLAKVIEELGHRLPGDAEIAKAQLDPIAAESIDEMNDHLMENFEKASELNPNDPDLLNVEMYLAVINEDPNLESHLEAYTQEYPNAIEGDIYLAGLYYKQGRIREARDSFFAAYAKNPQDPLVLANKGFVLGQHSTLGLLRYGDKIYTETVSHESQGIQ